MFAVFLIHSACNARVVKKRSVSTPMIAFAIHGVVIVVRIISTVKRCLFLCAVISIEINRLSGTFSILVYVCTALTALHHIERLVERLCKMIVHYSIVRPSAAVAVFTACCLEGTKFPHKSWIVCTMI